MLTGLIEVVGYTEWVGNPGNEDVQCPKAGCAHCGWLGRLKLVGFITGEYSGV